MNRLILTPAVLPPSALAELKQWLGITTTGDDALLDDLLATSLDICEAFTGQMPLQCGCEEVLQVADPGATADWQALATRPVQAITAVQGIAADGSRFVMAPGTYEIDLWADGTGRIRVPSAGAQKRVAVGFSAGLAPDWDGLPDALRHGLIRLAAHQHRERDGQGAGPLPPASVAALWRPWRRLRLA